MQLARAAAARTLAYWAECEAPQTAEPLSDHAAAPPSQQAAQPRPDRQTAPHTNPAPPRPASRPATAASYKPTDPAVLFTRLAAVVRDCIALEARLSAGATAAPGDRTPRDRTLRADPRRTLLNDALRKATKNHPDSAGLMREATTRLDEQLAADPDQTIHPGRLFFDLCEELGIEPDYAKLPDAIIFGAYGPADQDEDEPDPRATSPP